MKIYRPDEFIKEGTRIHVFTNNGRLRPEVTHVHDFIELVYFTHGRSRQNVDDRIYDVKHGDMIFINYGSTHSFTAEEPFGYYNICFSPEVVANSIISKENAFSLLSLTAFNELSSGTEEAKISFSGNERVEIENILSAMYRECQSKHTAWGSVLESYLNIIITKMLRKTEAGMGSEEFGSTWNELSEYIDANLEGDLTLEVLAQKCFYNPSYFSRVFKEKFGMSFVEYVNRKRLERAVELLIKTNLPIDEISTRVGYTSRSHFYHAFSKYIGGLPSNYRSDEKK